jgi:23S rRNA (guanosine2251-2'-O)-methyltransferase
MKGGAALNGDAVKTSAGALMKIPVCREHNLGNALKFIQSSGIKLIAATEKTDKLYTKTDMTEPVCFIMGSEDEGVTPEFLRMCNDMVRIPMMGSIESLNVSVAAGVLLYEVVRQRSE